MSTAPGSHGARVAYWSALGAFLRCGVLLLFAVVAGGCFSRETVIHLRPDGSGRLVVDTRVSQALLSYLRGMTGREQGNAEWGFDGDALRQRAVAYGQGVVYASHEVASERGGKWFRVVYRFEDISKVEVAVDTSLPFVGDPTSAETRPRLPPYRFHMKEEGKFEIRPPEVRPASSGPPRVRVESVKAARQKRERFQEEREKLMRYKNPFGLEEKDTPETVVKKLAEGMFFRIRVVPEGVVTLSNARHQTDQGMVLFSVEAPEALKDSETLRRASEGTLHGQGWAEWLRNPAVIAETGNRVLLYLRDTEGERDETQEP